VRKKKEPEVKSGLRKGKCPGGLEKKSRSGKVVGKLRMASLSRSIVFGGLEEWDGTTNHRRHEEGSQGEKGKR